MSTQERLTELVSQTRLTKLRAQRDEARAARDACLAALSCVHDAPAQIERVEALVAKWECAPGGSDYHRNMCPACRLTDEVRAAIAGEA